MAEAAPIPFLVLQGRRLLARVELRRRAVIGSDPRADIRLEHPAVEPAWGLLFERGGRVYAQPEGGVALEVEREDGLHVGPFVIARAEPGSRLAELAAAAEPGQELDWGEQQPFHSLVVTGAISRPAWMQGGSGKSSSLRSGRIESGTVAVQDARVAGLRSRTRDGAALYRLEPLRSAAVDQTLALIVRRLEAHPEDPGAVEDLGNLVLQELQRLTFAEVVAFLRLLAQGYDVNYLEQLYRLVINRHPLLAFRWALVLAERYAHAARGLGGRIELPDLAIGLDRLLDPDTLEDFRRMRAQGARLASRGPW
ncbi:MAG: hypothetical protein KatS3mg102_1629 [Planctomycetota bacterium]|nr:MAG: hypothetical protein KatS3mg102_1629 [Planctomycetota bacterium]